jgi:hypothetical protein
VRHRAARHEAEHVQQVGGVTRVRHLLGLDGQHTLRDRQHVRRRLGLHRSLERGAQRLAELVQQRAKRRRLLRHLGGGVIHGRRF